MYLIAYITNLINTEEPLMNIEKAPFGKINSQDVEKYTLTNDNGVSISVLTFAALWQAFNVPADKGTVNLLLSSDNLENYTNNPFYAGRIVGRIGGRLKGGQFEIDGTTYQVDQNEGNNSLHGGSNGFANQVWQATTNQTADSVSVTLSFTFTPAIDKFPGNLDAKVTYTLHKDNSVTIDFEGTTDANTLFNPTSHAYWNLSETYNILNHTFQANSGSHLEFDDEKIATGNLLVNANTPFDFNQPTLFKDAIDGMSNTDEKGFDDILVVDPDSDEAAATLKDQDSGRSIKLYSDRNGLVVFTANSFNDVATYTNGPAHPYQAVALEAQTLSDTPHHPNFGDVTLKANETKNYQIKIVPEF
ncbi:aldose 1-epimerase [Paucilactobacillus oligofermentans DSM 15707 = LMG 22743]|uniref:Maltose epimerase n=2 Tax=Paucilactobacillus oligofermentans TaxID=293371 RepID=A0A0R1RET2_9LACO|nr:aldose 1-epimerase [Paucilactobacillus oligofermentans DSM 15707 = LMG 22743]